MNDIEAKIQTLRPEPGDVVAIHTPILLSKSQREQWQANIEQHLSGLGCKVVLLEGCSGLSVIKQAAEAHPEPATGSWP